MTSEIRAKLLRLVARDGPPGKREIARDVLSGRHSPRDLAYLSSGPGMSSISPLLDRWEKTDERERASIVAGSDEAMSRILDRIKAAEIEDPAPEPARKPRRQRAEDEDSYFTENQWFPEDEGWPTKSG